MSSVRLADQPRQCRSTSHELHSPSHGMVTLAGAITALLTESASTAQPSDVTIHTHARAVWTGETGGSGWGSGRRVTSAISM